MEMTENLLLPAIRALFLPEIRGLRFSGPGASFQFWALKMSSTHWTLLPADWGRGFVGLKTSADFQAAPKSIRRLFLRAYRRGSPPRFLHPRKILLNTVDERPLQLLIAWLGIFPTRRKVISVWADNGGTTPSRVVKSPLDDWARHAVLREAATLQMLSRLMPGFAPTLLSLNDAEGVSHQSVIRCTQRVLRLDARILRRLQSVWQKTRETRSFRESHFCLQYCGSLDSLVFPKKEDRKLVRSSMEILDRRWSRGMETVLSHGDLHPGNLFLDEGEIRAIDWEAAAAGRVPLFDVYRFWFSRCWWSVRNGLRRGLAQARELSKKTPWGREPEVQGLAWALEEFVYSSSAPRLRSNPLSKLFLDRKRYCLKSFVRLLGRRR